MSKRSIKRAMSRRPASLSADRRLPAVFIALGVLLLAAVAWLAWPKPAPKAAIEVNGAPKLKADNTQVDLGNVKLGRTVSASFTLTNVGDEPLVFAEAPYVEVVEGC